MGQSLIEIEPVLDLEIPETEWIFFSSPKGAISYLNHHPLKAKSIAVFGEGTLKALKKFNVTANFIGNSEHDSITIGQKFNSVIGNNESVLFPISRLSKRNVIKGFANENYREIITYSTIKKPLTFNVNFDAILFTSPSNFKSFILLNKINSSTQIIAMGKTTESTIRKLLPSHEVHSLSEPTEKSLIEFFEKIESQISL